MDNKIQYRLEEELIEILKQKSKQAKMKPNEFAKSMLVEILKGDRILQEQKEPLDKINDNLDNINNVLNAIIIRIGSR